MNEFEREALALQENLTRLATKKNQLFARFYRGLGEFFGTLLIAIAIIALIRAF